jgi:ribonuclease BN (tRNA processing enzyme)
LRTTSFLLDNDVLIDAGSGVGDLSIAEMVFIDHIFITHSHLDHVAMIPLLVDTVGGMRDKPITLHATEEVLDILKQHMFNWKLWPDFTCIPDPDHPFLRYRTIAMGETVTLEGRAITVLPAVHTVPAVGYQIDNGSASLVFTGDTTSQEEFWHIVNRIENLRYLIIETAFSNAERDLAIASKHLYPLLLAEELAKFKREAEIYITHLKPGEIELTMQEIYDCAAQYRPHMLYNGKVFEF